MPRLASVFSTLAREGEPMLCARPICEEKENRINGYCTVYCEDIHFEHQRVAQLEAELNIYKQEIERRDDAIAMIPKRRSE